MIAAFISLLITLGVVSSEAEYDQLAPQTQTELQITHSANIIGMEDVIM
jgi:hypothetical protein